MRTLTADQQRDDIGRYKRQDVLERFLAKVEFTDMGCWLWKGSKDKDDYGRFEVNKKPALAHRFSYEYFCGPIPDDLEPDHLCRNHPCVNPDHLELVSHGENIRRGDLKAMGNPRRIKDHCPKGHPYNKENTYIDRRGKRNCRECRRKVNL